MTRFKATGYTEYCPCHDAPTLVVDPGRSRSGVSPERNQREKLDTDCRSEDTTTLIALTEETLKRWWTSPIIVPPFFLTPKFGTPDSYQPELKSLGEEWNAKKADAIRCVVRIALSNAIVLWPATFGHQVYFDSRQRIILVEYKLPDIQKLVVDWRREAASQLDLVERLICGWATRLLFDLAALLEAIPLRAIALNGFVAIPNSVAGADRTTVVLSVVAERQTLLSLDIDALNPRSAFHTLKGRLTESLGECSPITALVIPRRRRHE
jgi:hypothetical protein